MSTLRVLQRGIILWRNRGGAGPSESPEPTELPEYCPVATCERCGYDFTPYTVSAVCPRCLEPFSREQCYGGCFACPLLTGKASDES